MTSVVVMGAAGRMGQMLVSLVSEHPELKLVGAIEHSDHGSLGVDIGLIAGCGNLGVALTDDTLEAMSNAQIVLDFTTPELSAETASLAAQARAVHVIGTTGIGKDVQAKIDAAAHHAVIVQAGNMSLGVNLMTTLTETVARALDDIFDIEIVEAHHNRKVDAPSGTALMLGEAAAAGRGVSLEEAKDSGRDGITGARNRGDIGFSAIRGGDVVGEHDVIFAGPGERVVLRHMATDRRIFAHGALKAGLWGLGQRPGLYNMKDVLGLD